MGATVLEITLSDDATAGAAYDLLTAAGMKPPVREGSSLELSVDDGTKVVMEALRRLDDAAIIPTGLALREPSLDDVFLSLTGHRPAPDEEDDAEQEQAQTQDQERAAEVHP